MEGYKELLKVAQSDTGLDDFGVDSFREGFEILVDSLCNEANLNAVGEQIMRSQILGHLKQRLQVEDWYRRHPEIEDEQIIAPLFGVSLPRTGSSALSFLLAEDPNARSLVQWQATEPCPPPSTVMGDDDRSTQDPAKLRGGGKSHVPSSATGPTECQFVLGLDFKADIFQAFAKIPTYSEWMMDTDFTSAYLYERRVLKLLQWGFPNRPWRLKCPTHIGYMDNLVSAFPDARFVMTHRDPADVILSVIGVYSDIMGRFTDQVDLPYVAELNVHYWSQAIDRGVTFREQSSGDRFYDIHFRAMHKDPLGEVRGLYQWLGEEVTAEFAAGMTRWWKENEETREPNVRPDPAACKLDMDDVRQRFARYNERMERWTNVV